MVATPKLKAALVRKLVENAVEKCRNVDEGRRALNYSEWDRGQREARESAKSVRKGEMPPWFYALPGTSASLTPAERSTLIAGLELTFGSERTGANHRQKKNDD